MELSKSSIDERFMRLALTQAQMASESGEVPTGCVIVDAEGNIVAKAHNQTEVLHDATAHAEMIALSQAFAAIGNERLIGTTLYVTKEPCPMCAGAIALARVSRVVWGVSDPKRGGASVFDIFAHPGMNHHPETVAGLMEKESLDVLQAFFRARR
ncbi:MAG: tRNA adenosine(34) deaminase TadA [Kiritimatiellae bacterium]|nr:tRNA adenosine(34) deaminase TadA [Kiritimatiellia bacterium]